MPLMNMSATYKPHSMERMKSSMLDKYRYSDPSSKTTQDLIEYLAKKEESELLEVVLDGGFIKELLTPDRAKEFEVL